MSNISCKYGFHNYQQTLKIIKQNIIFSYCSVLELPDSWGILIEEPKSGNGVSYNNLINFFISNSDKPCLDSISCNTYKIMFQKFKIFF